MNLSGFRIQITVVCAALTLFASACTRETGISDSTSASINPPVAPTSAPGSTDPTGATTPASGPTAGSTPATAPATESTPATESGATTDWANFEYRSAECGGFSPITLINGAFTNQENALVVELKQNVGLNSGDTLVALSCLAGASGGTQSTELLLFGPDGNELAYKKLPLGEATISADGSGSVVYDEYGPDDPRCCPTGKSQVSFTVSDGSIAVGEPEVITPPAG